MTYAKKLSADKLFIIEPIVEKMKLLDDGEEFLVDGSPEHLDQLRGIIYNYLWINNQKSLFKVSRPAPTKLRIKRNAIIKYELLDEIKTDHSEYVVNNLLDLSTEEEVISQMRADSIKSSDRLNILKEWRRLQSK